MIYPFGLTDPQQKYAFNDLCHFCKTEYLVGTILLLNDNDHSDLNY